ncbi:zinc knuckle transcription factor [Pyrenophora seminiperda CCB06]|uniref:Zinc knuckle transcription factor n=1 Tax=Pyrenophora seminiperda CCB06 TaxID=1302712 RepID=A0A3M7LZR1_9PLEO|nr:zinc knuckle transcription factor [Pyrenophora seminiperda CCB06]
MLSSAAMSWDTDRAAAKESWGAAVADDPWGGGADTAASTGNWGGGDGGLGDAKEKDLDVFRVGLKAYARATQDEGFNLPAVEEALREDGIGVFLIAKQQEVPPNMTIVDLIGNPDRKFVLTLQLSAKPRRQKYALGFPDTPEENMERLASCGYMEDRGVPLCDNCHELGHVRKHCKQELVEREKTQPEIQCVYCQAIGHRARDCPQERVDPFACKNCKQSGHTSKECPEPRSAEGVECRKCNETGHFSKERCKAPKKEDTGDASGWGDVSGGGDAGAGGESAWGGGTGGGKSAWGASGGESAWNSGAATGGAW